MRPIKQRHVPARPFDERSHRRNQSIIATRNLERSRQRGRFLLPRSIKEGSCHAAGRLHRWLVPTDGYLIKSMTVLFVNLCGSSS